MTEVAPQNPEVPGAPGGEDGGDGDDPRKQQAIAEFTRLMLQHKELDARVRNLRMELKEAKKQFDKTEGDLTALQSMGQIIGEVLRQLDEDRFIVKASSGPRYIVGCRSKLDREKLVNGTRVTLDMTTLTIMRALPREVDPVVFNMLSEAPGKVEYSSIGGLGEQIKNFALSGGNIFGICGGLQILGESLEDPLGTEHLREKDSKYEFEGLGLLPIKTIFKSRNFCITWPIYSYMPFC